MPALPRVPSRRLAPRDLARCSACRCGARASRRWRAWRTASGSRPTGSCSATSTARGPLAGDDPRPLARPGGSPRIANTGAWVYEPPLLHRARPPHPYWPGGAILLEDDGDPRAVGLLDGLDPAALR